MALSILCDEESRQNVKDAMEQQHPDVKLEGEEKKGGPYWTLMYNSDDITVGMTAMINGASSAVLV